MRADGSGALTDVPVNDWIDVGVFGDEGKVLYLEKHLFTGNATKVEVEVTAAPREAGIDPYNKLVDRDSDDNRKRMSRALPASSRPGA
jgi:hypothetical protein